MNTIGRWALIAALCSQYVAIAAEPAPRSQYGVSYLSGGVGDDERQAMLAVRQDYRLRLTFASKGSGEYQADVAVSVRDRSGMEVANFVSAGPLCYLNLDPGSYSIHATVRGKELTQTVVVNRHGARELYFYWDQE